MWKYLIYQTSYKNVKDCYHLAGHKYKTWLYTLNLESFVFFILILKADEYNI